MYRVQRPAAAFCLGAAVAILGGLIGLGGAEFRLPILIYFFELYPHRAIRINLLISLATLTASAISRFGFSGASNVTAFEPVIAAMIAGGMVSAWIGAGFLSRIPKDAISSVIAVLLLIVATLLFFEAPFPLAEGSALLPNSTLETPIAFFAGLLVGAVSSLLGVAGGEFIIPILVFTFGAGIKTAGTASVLISTPLIAAGIARHILEGRFRSKTMLTRLVLPMSAGSIAGAVIGGWAAQWAQEAALKAILAVILATWSLKLVKKH
jgi:uncharacterized protein